MSPLLFQPNTKHLVWGSEEWSVSAVPGSESEIATGPWSGRLLTDFIDSDPEHILGRAVAANYGNSLPLLVKIIDARKDLSIQVHPNDEMAQRVHGKMGKSEMWYVLDAEPGAYLYAGFKQKITPEEYRRRVADGTITEVLARHEVSAGHVFYLPAGRVHAICGGIRLAEVQQSSDVTYRIFDYNRPGLDGKPRELHTELAAEAIDYEVVDEYRTLYNGADNSANIVVDSPYFTTRVVEANAPLHRNLVKYDSFVITTCLEGSCTIRIRDTREEVHLEKEQSCFIPAVITDYDVLPEECGVKLLDSFIDNMDRSLSGKMTRFLHITKK
jgi:mannose-6-phosphate isomerase